MGKKKAKHHMKKNMDKDTDLLKKISEVILIGANIILALFAVVTFFSVGNQFEKSNRPFIGFESGGDNAMNIVESVVYDKKPDIGEVWLPEDVAAGITLNFALKNFGDLPAFFNIEAFSVDGEIEPYEKSADFIMPGQTINSRWNYKWTKQVPDMTKELLSFKINYSSNKQNKNEYSTNISTNFIKLPTKDLEEARNYPYRIGNEKGEIFALDFFIKEIK